VRRVDVHAVRAGAEVDDDAFPSLRTGDGKGGARFDGAWLLDTSVGLVGFISGSCFERYRRRDGLCGRRIGPGELCEGEIVWWRVG
jgi:hypothetical protein